MARRFSGKLRGLFSKSPVRGAAEIVGSSVIAQLITFLLLPVLSRLYGPVSYGHYAVIIATAALVSALVSLRFETATMLPPDLRMARAITGVCLRVSILLSALAGLILWLSLQVWHVVDLDVPGTFVLWVVAISALSAIFRLLTQLTLRDQRYRTVAQRNVVQIAGTTTTQLASATATRSFAGLSFGTVIGYLLACGMMLKTLRTYLAPSSRVDRREVWRTYWKYPAIFAPSALLNTAGLQLPVLLIAFWFGSAAAGLVGMADRIVAVPLAVIGNSLGQIMEGEFTKRLRDGRDGYRKLYLRTSAVLAAVGIALVLGVLFLAEPLVDLLFGAEWTEVSTLLKIISVTAACRLVAGPLSRVLTILQRGALTVSLDLLRIAAVVIVAIVVTAQDLSFHQSVTTLYWSLAVVYVVTWVSAYVVCWQQDLAAAKAQHQNSGEVH